MRSRLATIAVALCLPLALAACGVRGPLELPPSAQATEPAAPTPPVAERQGPAIIGQARTQPTLTPTARAAATAPASSRRSVLDVLID